ncbi:type VI secretion system-associated protein TagO [Jannaschia pohangensis]|uniref:Type VI secretion system VasI, EvfG, VC_A0118 n=1 Tax=Jannaschia pohangensis TaxID=390807 RepID=A0A1I3LYP7_9RHOB|nr:type VI secretion system-associated protein TagO [Jannaschia pohangensis]SFI89615.1 Type VI secretion system VasI, EvfG, VC_A0118 [Jannaschia pohangensis]
MPSIPRPLIYLTAALSGIAVGYSLPSDAPETDVPPRVVRDVAPPAPPMPVALTVGDADVVEDEPAGPAWVLRTEPAAFDDLTNVYLSVPSDQPLRCGPRRRASLMLRCLEDRTAIYIAHDCATPPMDPEGWDVDLRFDQNAVQNVDLPVDSHGEAFGHWTYREARTLMEELLSAQTLSVRFTDLTGTESQMSFPVASLAEPLETLKQACHWSAVPPWEQIDTPRGDFHDDGPVADLPAAIDEPGQLASAEPRPVATLPELGDVSLTSGSTRSFMLRAEVRPGRALDPAPSAPLETGTPVFPETPTYQTGLTTGERRLLEHDGNGGNR